MLLSRGTNLSHTKPYYAAIETCALMNLTFIPFPLLKFWSLCALNICVYMMEALHIY